MGIFDKARSSIVARKAYKTYTEAVSLAGKGQPEAAKEKYQSALGQYAEAVRLGGQTANTCLSYALLLMREGDFEKSKAVMQDISRWPNLADDARFQLRIQYSILLWKTGELDEAIATIRRAAATKMNGAVYSTLGMYLVDKARQTGDFEEALAFNEKAMDYDDEDGDILDNMARLNEIMADAEASNGASAEAAEHRARAKALYEKAHERRPRQITTIYDLGRMYQRDGELDKARALLSGADRLYYSAVCPVTREQMEALCREVGV